MPFSAIQYVGSGLSLAAFVVAAIMLAYRARLQQRASIIRKAPADQRIAAIEATAEFFNVPLDNLTTKQKHDIVLAQISARSRRDMMAAICFIIVAILIVSIVIINPQRINLSNELVTTHFISAPVRKTNVGGSEISISEIKRIVETDIRSKAQSICFSENRSSDKFGIVNVLVYAGSGGFGNNFELRNSNIDKDQGFCIRDILRGTRFPEPLTSDGKTFGGDNDYWITFKILATKNI